jgi:hypothetical protein
MTSKQKSCGVAFPIERNCATSDTQGATAPATYPQPMSLKSLASKVLQRNQERNLSATSQEIDRNFSPENEPQKLRVAAPMTLDGMTDRQPATNNSTPAPCRDCNRVEILTIMGEDAAGCLYPAAGEYPEGWRRLPGSLTRCIWHTSPGGRSR